MNDPFDYTPHPLCRVAADAVRRHLSQRTEWADEVAAGKMFGVLVCEDDRGQLGFLAAYSGQIGGREDWPWFVPAVFDYLKPDGYFKQEEGRISAINRRVATLQSADDYVSAKAHLRQLQAQANDEVEAYRTMMQHARQERHALRAAQTDTDEAEEASRVLESQFQKAELRRLKARWRERLAEAEALLRPTDDEIARLRQERSARSDGLQRWLFDRFAMLNAHGERRTLTRIFATEPQGTPPSGAGECCAPKLLQYAYAHGLRPLQIAEFWQGRSPRMEVRHHDHYYPACRGKCRPILRWMLGTPMPSQPMAESVTAESLPKVVYADDVLLVVDKPAGLLSVPGRSTAPSVESLLRRDYGEVFMVHRLDMDTSGLLVVARTADAYHDLQRQFLARTIYKRYVALLDGLLPPGAMGTVSLPLRPDLLDRPRQLVDPDHGRDAVTHYRVVAVGTDGRSRVELEPHTGRTHQLRLHCAHADGLGTPIVGDPLYGQVDRRLCLHAAELRFRHPVTGQPMVFTSVPDF